MADQNNKALEILEKMEKLSETKYLSPMYKAFIFMGLGNKDKAFTYIDKAFIEREPFLFYLKTVPTFDSLRSDPRFTELLNKIGFV